jgi:ornithine decarboxylase
LDAYIEIQHENSNQFFWSVALQALIIQQLQNLMHQISYAKGINDIGNIIKKTKIIPDYINVGGGFPAIYPDLIPQALDSYFNEIKKSLENLKLEKLPEIICEPGRALVAESGSTIVKVNLRKKRKLYINDGTYGTLFDAGTPNIVFPSKMIK